MVAKWLHVNEHPDGTTDHTPVAPPTQEDFDAKIESVQLTGDQLCFSGPAEPLLSPQVLAEWRAAGGSAFVSKLLNNFVFEATVCVEKIQVALESQNAHDVLEAGHCLKGMAANMGLTQLAKIAHQLETLGRQHNLLAGPPVLDAMQKEFARVHEALQDVLNQEQLHSN